MLGNNDRNNLSINAYENSKLLKSFSLPYYKDIILPEKTTKIDIFEYVEDISTVYGNCIQSIYLGKKKDIVSLAKYAKMAKKGLTVSQDYTFIDSSNTSAIYIETDTKILINDIVSEDVLAVPTLEELNVMANMISEEYAEVKRATLNLKKHLYK